MHAELVSFLRCPHCGGEFAAAPYSLQCANGHSFDIARQGYVNLLPGGASTGTADTAAMVAAREAFLGAGHFAGLRQMVAETAARVTPVSDASAPPASRSDTSPSCIIEVGAGTGYYLAGVLERLPDRLGLALDLSKFALRRAAWAHGRIGAVVCDTWTRLPVRDGCAALVLDIFAPRNASEFRRALEPEGRLIVVTPTQRHLAELIPTLGLVSIDSTKQKRLDQKLASDFALVESARHEKSLALAPHEIAAAVGMGPSSRHLQDDELGRRIDRLALSAPRAASGAAPGAAPEPVRERSLPVTISVTVSVSISVYRPL
ncbi:MAG: 23S rRNA methyltransferase [bacterium]